MDKDLQTRYIAFIVIFFAIWFGYLNYIDLQRKAARPVGVEETVTDGTGATTNTLTVAGQRDTQLMPGDGTGLRNLDGTPFVEADRPTDLEPVIVETDSYEVHFSPAGAVPILWNITDEEYLVHHYVDENDEIEFASLIDPDLDEEGLARPFEIILREQDAAHFKEFNSVVYTASPVTTTDDWVTVTFTSPRVKGDLELQKKYKFPKRGFECEVEYVLRNYGSQKINFNSDGLGLGVALGPGLGVAPEQTGGLFASRFDFTEVFYELEDELQDSRFDKDGSTKIVPGAVEGIPWGGIHDRYFMISLTPVPNADTESGFEGLRGRIDKDVAAAGLSTEKELQYYPRGEFYRKNFSLPPGTELAFNYEVYAGPKDREVLKATEKGYDDILFHTSFRWFRALCLMLMSILNLFHNVFGNWGVAIIALVVLLRVMMFPLTMIQMKHQAEMMAQQATLKPYLDKINEKYKDDPQKKNMETMKLYREHGMNPFGMLKGCVWVLIQFPIFIALYRILLTSIDLRGAGFLWIEDLSVGDHLFPLPFQLPILGGSYFNLLPFISAITQLFVSKMAMKASPTGGDNPMQKQMMYMMPFMILIFTYSFPSGLFIYWVVSNLWQLVQQQFITNRVMREKFGDAGVPAK